MIHVPHWPMEEGSQLSYYYQLMITSSTVDIVIKIVNLL